QRRTTKDQRRQYIVTRYIYKGASMAAIEEHKPAEKRRALGRGLDSLLPSRPQVVTSPPVTMPPATRTGMSEPHGPVIPQPVVIPAAVTPRVRYNRTVWLGHSCPSSQWHRNWRKCNHPRP